MVRQICLLGTLCGLMFLAAACAAPPPTVSSAPTPTDQARSTVPPASLHRQPTSEFVEGTPQAPLQVHGKFVYAAGDGSLWLQNADGGAPVTLVERARDSIAQLPSFSPDGKRVVYAALLFLADSSVRGDIRALDTTGTAAQTVVRAPGDEIVYLYPRFEADGRLLVTRAENLQTINERARLEWVSAEGGASPQPLIEDARDGDVSPAGKQIAFVRYNPQTSESSLWVADADGAHPRELVPAGTFAAIQSPRFSRDGKWLAFGVHGEARSRLPLLQAFRKLEDDCAVRLLVFCLVRSASAHMAPGALWRVEVQSGKFQPMTDVYDDSPVPAWSRDGSLIAIHDFTGIRVIDIVHKGIYPLFLEDGGMGGFDWFDR